ncbi:MAG: RHS repeat protein [Desulfobacteraceae bacterium]|nr:RHS repeat protein [Desulfobacteraceae bacterium]
MKTETTREDKFYRFSNDRVRVVVENSNGIQATPTRISRSAADPNGNPQKVSSCVGVDSVGECTGETVRTFIIRDDLGRPTQVKQTVGDGSYRVVNYGYSSGGRITTVTRGTGAEQTQDVYEYDALGRLTNVTQSGGTTQAAYDSAGRMLKITDAQGNQTNFGYDGLGRITSRSDADSNVSWQYTDSTGTVVRSESGVSITYTYNRLGELGQIAASDGNTFIFAYDARGRLISENWSGTGGSGSRTYAYNVYGELTGVTGTFGLSVNYTRDAIGRLMTKILWAIRLLTPIMP